LLLFLLILLYYYYYYYNTLMLSSLRKFTVGLNFALLFWKLLVFGFLLVISETSLCSVSVLLVIIVLLLDALQQLMLFVET
jgi:hypothetical protein